MNLYRTASPRLKMLYVCAFLTVLRTCQVSGHLLHTVNMYPFFLYAGGLLITYSYITIYLMWGIYADVDFRKVSSVQHYIKK